MQRIVTADAMRAALEVKDYAGASRRRSELEVVGVPKEMKPEIAVLRGRLAEALAHDKDALDAYKYAANTSDRPSAAEGKLLELLLRKKRGEIGQPELVRELETLSAVWRGDAIEVKTLAVMSQIYADTGRYSESLGATKTATRLQPNSELTRQSQDAASALFAQLYLSPKGDDMKPIDALGMFYEYRELTPIGRRGDEMIRRLSERLVAVDLLDQAAELLQYQVDKRLEGAARAQVAARLAMVYLTNRKTDRAISALRTTRIADLSGELRQQRLLLEGRAQSDVGRHDLALDIISNITGREAIRLRSDIYWASRQWREASEQIELYYADRWRDFKPLNAVEKGRRDPRGGRICARRRHDRPGSVPREIRAADVRRYRPDGVRPRQQAGRRQQRRVCRGRQDGGGCRYARRLHPRNEGPLPRRHRARTAAGGRAGPHRFLARDRRNQAGRRGKITVCAANGLCDIHRTRNRHWQSLRVCALLAIPRLIARGLRVHRRALKPSGRLSFDAADPGPSCRT
jgi:hypothetical protein